MHNDLRPASLAGGRLERYFHTCAFFDSRDEEYRVLSPFLKEGLQWGEKAVYIIDPKFQCDHLQRLAASGVDLEAHGKQVEILTWHDTYLREGRFDQELMLTAVNDTISAGWAQGYPRTRIVGQMNWALETHPGVDQLLEYEVRVNDVLVRTKQPAVCVYDVNKLSGSMMMDLLRVHPLTIVGGTLYENPFYTPAEQMLRSRRPTRESAHLG